MQLNPQQMAIVDFPHDQSSLVMAGAGSGKTTVIANRALKMAERLPAGFHIQMLTFSNKAASEMKARVKRLNGILPGNVRFDTFHSYGLRLIKSDPAGFGLAPEFSLLSDSDQKRSLRALAHGAGLPKKLDPQDKKRLNPMNWLGTWSLKRQAGYDVRNETKNGVELRAALRNAHRLNDDETRIAWETLFGYEQQKISTNCLDFDDLLFLPLLRAHKDPAFLYETRLGLSAMIVDESQDTNRIQYEFIRKVALGCCPTTMVGDDDQSIYGWRGAEVKNLHRFVHHFSAEQLKLEENYRSTQAIVNMASDLIRHNEQRLDKSPFSSGPVGEDPQLRCFDNSWDLVDGLARSIRSQLDEGISPSDIAVLYRTNRMSMLIEPAMRKFGIPYHVVGGMSLFDRAEIAAVTTAIRLARNPRDVGALKSMAGYIHRFGESSTYAVCDWLENDPTTSLYSLPASIPGVPPNSLVSLRSFMTDLQGEALICTSIKEFVQWVIDGPVALLDREKDELLREKRAQHLEMLVRNVDAELIDRRANGEELSWRDIIGEIALRESGQSQGSADQVTLSTLHRSKGLEWAFVYLPGMSEGLLPLDARGDASDDTDAAFLHEEEERRLAYVGITRAKTECVMLHADVYMFPGAVEEKTYEPSRFLAEMGFPLEQLVTQARYEDNQNQSCESASFDASAVMRKIMSFK